MPSAMIRRIQQHRRDRRVDARHQRLAVVLEELVAGPKRHRRLDDLGLGDGRGDEGQPDREEDEQHADDQPDMGQPDAPAAFFDHAFAISNAPGVR